MNGNVRIMLCQGLNTQSAPRLLYILLLISVASVRTGLSCGNQSCGRSLNSSIKLTRLMHAQSVKLLKSYKSSQGDSAEFICHVQIDNVPEADISELDVSKRMLSIYARLKEFSPHFKRVLEQQTDLQPHATPLLTDLTSTQERLHHISHRVNCLLQILLPNTPIPEPPEGPTGVPPSQNTFQQKAYGCVVLTRFKDFLSQTMKELRNRKGKLCKRRTLKSQRNL
ncbi:IL-6 subfamily cytokine M17 [Denticeps clupeoides]|uniref:Ciliary neurotrophic factor n=1 Tax=Denticeps clupeoides TaxID=299321 RepID=A0AAY4D7G9_9TELE|nr:uncharacterized protein LOC114786800 [Denticeps clupeoides]